MPFLPCLIVLSPQMSHLPPVLAQESAPTSGRWGPPGQVFDQQLYFMMMQQRQLLSFFFPFHEVGSCFGCVWPAHSSSSLTWSLGTELLHLCQPFCALERKFGLISYSNVTLFRALVGPRKDALILLGHTRASCGEQPITGSLCTLPTVM